ncbi:hypothetical protein PFLUV_G00113630 [Perca fluviatilis]|uniref:Uncharacterized protein n=1 Tax=Perca fluviatilis TaxID=8168 RepID=A0A6A5F9G8_PERFL|nr:hypothetical protein PFLUV_G00113630 [Perca fluviatilis]
MTDCITEYIKFCENIIMPSWTVCCFPNHKPWITSDLKVLLNEKKKAFRSWDRQELREVQHKLRDKLRECKNSYRRKLEASLQQNNMREVWTGMKEITGCGGEETAGKAAGPDGISPRVLKTCTSQLSVVLQYIFNLSLSLQRVPLLWKTSCLVPVPKKSTRSGLKDYRPVALTSHVIKVLERLLAYLRPQPCSLLLSHSVEASASLSGHSAAYARKRFTLEGLSNRRSLPAEPAVKEAVVPRRFSLASSSSFATRHTKGTLSASVKSKRHEIKSDPTPFGYEDTLHGALAAVRKRQSMTSSTATAAGGTSAVPRSTSQPGWAQQRLPSMDTDDFEPIPSSAEESSNSSEEEGNNKNDDSGRFRVQLTYESCEARDLSETGDLVQFLKEAQSGQ